MTASEKKTARSKRTEARQSGCSPAFAATVCGTAFVATVASTATGATEGGAGATAVLADGAVGRGSAGGEGSLTAALSPVGRSTRQCRTSRARVQRALSRMQAGPPYNPVMRSDIRVRIAPSPTGPLHIGTARTALYNFLFARHTGGTFVLRLEDTDVARSTAAFEKDILDGLHWLGITWDEGPGVAGVEEAGPYAPYRQMARLGDYAAAAQDLLEKDAAYPCYCTPEELEADRKVQEAAKQPVRYLGHCAALTPDERAARAADGRRAALRFRVRPGIVGWNDLVRDRVEIDTANLGGDFVIVRADGNPLYHFTVVVDDMAMQISHVIRGEDHVSNTPKHILLFEALGYPLPVFGHLPLILNPDGTKMSKRKSQTAVADYVAQGFLREALVNYFSFLGWSPGTEEDVLTLDEIVERFELDKVHKGGARFDRERLEWLNGQWIRRLDDEDLVERLMPFLEAAEVAGQIDRLPSTEEVRSLLPIVRERLSTLASIVDAVGFLWIDDLAVDPAAVVPKRWDAATTREGARRRTGAPRGPRRRHLGSG